MNKIIIITESITYAVKAKRLLSSAGIPSKLIKTDASISKTGCNHGIMISNSDFLAAVKILRDFGINYTVREKNG